MSKKEKKVSALAKDFQAMIALIPKLEAFIKVHNEIAAGYQKYRKNGGDPIPGIEKHMGIKEQDITPALKAKKTVKVTETKAPVKGTEAIKTKKKLKK